MTLRILASKQERLSLYSRERTLERFLYGSDSRPLTWDHFCLGFCFFCAQARADGSPKLPLPISFIRLTGFTRRQRSPFSLSDP